MAATFSTGTPKTTTTTNAAPDLKAGLLANIAKLMNPTAESLAESDNRAAAQNVASGMPGQSAFGQNRGLVLRDSEQRDRLKQANEMYQPFLQRESAEGIAASGQAAETQRQILAGEQAMERLRLSESGESARLSQKEAADLKLQALEGEQAMMRQTASEKGAMDRLLVGNQGDIQKTILSAYLDPRYNTESATPYQPAEYKYDVSPLGRRTSTLVTPEQAAQPARRSVTNSADINRLLAQYGVNPQPSLSQYNF